VLIKEVQTKVAMKITSLKVMLKNTKLIRSTLMVTEGLRNRVTKVKRILRSRPTPIR
jgi:hypothetical protein